MRQSDEHIQTQIENGEQPASTDGKIYKIIFAALSKDPGYKLPSSFAEKVMHFALVKRERKSRMKEMIWLSSGVLVFIAAAIVAIVVTGFKFSQTEFRFLYDYRGLIGFGAALLIAFQWIEKLIFPRKSATH